MPPPPEVSPTAGVAELRQLLIEFSQSMYKSVAALPGAVRSLDNRTGLLRRLLVAFLVMILLDIGITVILGIILHQRGHTQAELNTAVDRLNRVVHNDCLLYGLIIPNYHPGNSPQRTSYPGGPAAYDGLYIGMENASDYIDCGIPHNPAIPAS
jgi:hypothetical protein